MQGLISGPNSGRNPAHTENPTLALRRFLSPRDVGLHTAGLNNFGGFRFLASSTEFGSIFKSRFFNSDRFIWGFWTRKTPYLGYSGESRGQIRPWPPHSQFGHIYILHQRNEREILGTILNSPSLDLLMPTYVNALSNYLEACNLERQKESEGKKKNNWIRQNTYIEILRLAQKINATKAT